MRGFDESLKWRRFVSNEPFFLSLRADAHAQFRLRLN